MLHAIAPKQIAQNTFPDSAVFTLSEEEKKVMLELVQRVNQLDPYLLTLEQVAEARITLMPIASRLLTRIINFKYVGNEYGAILIRNLPIDSALPDTPVDGRPSALKKDRTSEKILLACLVQLGCPIAYIDEKEGSLVQNICPVQGQEDKQENTGSVLLEFHTEDGFHPYKPDYLSLLCLKSDHHSKAITVTSSVRRVLPYLPSIALETLRRPLFRISNSPSFSNFHGSESIGTDVAILKGSLFDPELCLDYHLMQPLTSQAKWAMNILREELTKHACGVALQPGDLLIVDNRRAIHARTAFEPSYDGQDRWLQRMFVVEDFRRSQWARAANSLICAPLDSLLEALPTA